MQRKENISEELREVSGLVADISRIELFEVPQGYFEGFAGRIMERIGSMESGERLSPALLDAREQPLYSIPEGYFEGFAGKMLARIHASEELAALSPLLSGIGKKSPFQTPEGYFKASLAGMGALLQENAGMDSGSLSPLLASLKDKTVYLAPEGYFAGLADTVLARVKEPVSDLKKERQVAPVPSRTQTPVIAIGSGRKWLRYAAAAIIAGLIVTAGSLGLHKISGKTGKNDLIASIPNNLPGVSDQEIQNYLDDQDDHSLADGATNSTATLDFNDNDVKDLLGDVPDNELKMYLEEHSASKDVVTN
ncbi:MAG TPA: hypothetical protein VK563_11660 [Puia sp.]|nr:hypothetical protein [Puia sp.]